MVDPDFGGDKPTMFICGNNDDAKKTTTDLLTEIGWDAEDMGKVEAARAIEPLCILSVSYTHLDVYKRQGLNFRASAS